MFAHVSNVARKCRTTNGPPQRSGKPVNNSEQSIVDIFSLEKKRKKNESEDGESVESNDPGPQALFLQNISINSKYSLTLNSAVMQHLFSKRKQLEQNFLLYLYSCYFALVMHMHTHTRIQCFWGIYKFIFARQLNDNGCSIPLSIFAHIYQVILVHNKKQNSLVYVMRLNVFLVVVI